MITCGYCAKENDANAVFCIRCQRLLSVRDVSSLPKTTLQLQEPKTGQLSRPAVRQPSHTLHIGQLGNGRVGLYVGDDFLCVDVIEKCFLGRTTSTDLNEVNVDLSKYAALEKGVSRVHCAFAWEGSSLTVEDLKSSNGTWLNSVRLTPYRPRTIENGDMILLGKLDMWVYYR